MKILPLFALLFLALPHLGLAQASDAPSVPGPKSDRPSTATPIQSYREVLALVPSDLRGIKVNAWTQIQRDAANAALKEALTDHGTPARLRLKVVDIADWDGMTFYADIPNHEGYPIRVFGKFTEEWRQKLATLQKGDTALLEGDLSSVSYLDLWGEFTLSICLQHCTFLKLEAPDKSTVAL